MSVRTDHSQFLTKEYVVRKCHVLRVSSTYLGSLKVTFGERKTIK